MSISIVCTGRLHVHNDKPSGSGSDGRGCLSSLVASEAEISSLWWASVDNHGMQGSRSGAGLVVGQLGSANIKGSCSRAGVYFWVRLLVACCLRKWRRQMAANGDLHNQAALVSRLGLLGSQLSFVPNLHAYWGILGRACCRSPTAMLKCVVGRQALACVLGHCSVSCVAYLLRRHSIVPNILFLPHASPLGAAVRGRPRDASCVPRATHGRTCSSCFPIVSSPDLLDAEHTMRTRTLASVYPKNKRVALRANDARHHFGLFLCGRRSR
ncbi:UNVERIFIED_CONTAM: hypothetical protein Sindi_2496200 [Sesamum indicum]